MELKTNFEDNDSKLVMYIHEGNDDAKIHLYRKYSALIHKEVNRVKKKAFMYGIEYADLSQEAMLAFGHAVNTYNESENVKFITFATTILRRKLSSYIEKLETNKNKATFKILPIDAGDINKDNTLINQVEEIISTEPLRKLINNETLGEVNKEIKQNLSAKEKKALDYTISGISVNDIAREMNITTKQVYNLVYRARKKIKMKL